MNRRALTIELHRRRAAAPGTCFFLLLSAAKNGLSLQSSRPHIVNVQQSSEQRDDPLLLRRVHEVDVVGKHVA